MHALNVMLAWNGFESIARGLVNLARPTIFYLPPEAPKYAQDTVRVLAITYLAVGVMQLGACRLKDRQAVRLVAGASMLFAAGVALQAATQGSGSSDVFHQSGERIGPVTLNNAWINVLWSTIYAVLLLREAR
jgi:hypothetical protein